MAPTIEAYTETFDDKVNDSRFDGTFAHVFYGNWGKAGNTNESLINANGLPVKNGEAVLTFLETEPLIPVTYPTGAGPSNVSAGTLPGRADWVIAPSGISRIYYPGLWKLGTYRTDNGTGLGQPNGAITRPWNIAKFSEFYLIAAEAAVKGATSSMTARQLVNVLRARAGKWRWKNNGNYELVADNTPVVYTRTIEKHHYLRPIPQGQIDGMTMSEEEKAAYQNPGY